MAAVVRLARAALALALAAAPLGAQEIGDSLRASRQPLFTARDGWVALGIAGGAVLLMATVDEPVARALTDENGRVRRPLLDDAARGLKFVNEKSALGVSAAAWLVGLGARREGMARFGLHSMEAIVLSSAVHTLVKGGLGRARPFRSRLDSDDGEYDAFDLNPGKGFSSGDWRAMPSLHTGGVVAFATVLSDELDRWRPGQYRWVRPALYTVAVLPGLARMYDDKHWASDVLVGAAVGYASGRTVSRYTRTHPNNRLDRWLLRDTALGADPRGTFTVQWTVATPF